MARRRTPDDVTVGTKEPSTIDAGSHTDLVRTARDAWAHGLPRELLPVCEDNGDLHCLTSSGQIAFRSHDGASTERWPDLATWIQDVWIDEG